MNISNLNRIIQKMKVQRKYVFVAAMSFEGIFKVLHVNNVYKLTKGRCTSPRF